VRSRLLKTTVMTAVAWAIWTHMPQVSLPSNITRRLSLKCWLLGHEDWIRRAPDRLYLECFECGRVTQGWVTGRSQPTGRAAGAFEATPVIKLKDHSAPASVRSLVKGTPRSDRSVAHHDDTAIPA
jgi:hypothetical protein